MSKKLKEIIDFFEQEEGYSKEEMIADILGEMSSLKGLSADEVGLEWDGESLPTLDVFANEFYDQIIVKVCNVIKSFAS